MRTTICTLATLLMLATSVRAAPPSVPDPRLSAREVVQLQLAALQSVDKPVKDAGFATVFRFTSPGNREQTGPLPRFAQMIRQGFGELINHRSAVLLAPVQQGEQVLQPVEVVSFGGRKYRYVFVLRRQDDEGCRACWLTDGVIPRDVESAPSAQEL